MKKNVLSIAAVLAAFSLFVAPVMAAGFTFDNNLEGDAEVEWDFTATESNDETVSAGANYNFNGNAGTNGNAVAEGQWTGVGGVFLEAAGGYGLANSNTSGTNYAEAGYASGALSVNGGYAADQHVNGFMSEIEYSGLATAGGAGSVETGLTSGWETVYNNSGSGAGSYEFNNSGSSDFTLVP